MIRYTSQNEGLIFNHARQNAVSALKQALKESYGKQISEKDLKNRWIALMSQDKGIYSSGWYCPPGKGAAVLFDERLNFDSLRNEQFWSGEKTIDWGNGLLYAYCSPVDRESGYIGDMSVTLYFGEDERIRDHFRNCRAAIGEIFASLEAAEGPKEIFLLSLEIFRKHSLRSNVISRTDPMPSNLGHTFTHLDKKSDEKELSREDVAHLSSSRKFLNGSADWQFEEGMQFTIEPQLLSLDDPSLPKVTHHYAVKKTDGGFIVCDDIDEFLMEYGLK